MGGKEEDGTGGSITEAQRKIIGMHSRMSSSVLGWAIFSLISLLCITTVKLNERELQETRGKRSVTEKEVRKNCGLCVCVCVCHYSTRLLLWSAE